MKRLPLLASAALAALPLLAVDTPETDLWFVTSAQVVANGAHFVTSLRIVNPGATTANVTLKFLPQIPLSGGQAPGDNTAGPTATVPVGAGQTALIEDVIGTKFGGAAVAGGIHLTSDAPVVAMSQTLNILGQSATGVPGTYGFAIPPQTLDNALALGETAYLSYVSGWSVAGRGYRTNLFLLSANASGATTVHVKLVRADGSTVGENDYQLGKLAQTQINGIAAVFGTSETNLTAVVTVTSGGPVFLGASVIDNAINSLLYTPPVKIWHPRNAAFGVVLDDGNYGFSGRLDFVNGLPVFLSAGLVLEGCPAAPGPLLFFVQMGPSYGNATFTPNADGTFTINGAMHNSDGSLAATVSGAIALGMNGAVAGEIIYTRATTPGNQCGGVGKTFPFYGTKAAALTAP